MSATDTTALPPTRSRAAGLGRLLRAAGRHWPTLAGATIVVVSILAALFAPWLAPYDPVEIDILNKLMPPSPEYLLGTDQGGRDILSRMIWGARASLTVSLCAVVIGLTGGVLIGLLAAYQSGTWLEQVIMRAIDAIASIPLLIWAIAIIGIIGLEAIQVGPFTFTNVHKLLVLIGLLYMPTLARITHAVAQVEMTSDYVKARKVQGASNAAIMFGDVLPNCMSPLIVQATLLVAIGIVVEASVSFVGLGVQPPTPSWGSMLADGRNYVFSGEWWLTVFPGIAISLTVIGFNLLGDGLRDILDPRRSAGRMPT